jgi:hypothetical protein
MKVLYGQKELMSTTLNKHTSMSKRLFWLLKQRSRRSHGTIPNMGSVCSDRRKNIQKSLEP